MLVELTRTAASAVRRGHPWVYREGVLRAPRALTSGRLVDLQDDAGARLGRGLWDADGPLAVRVLPREAVDARGLVAVALRAIARRDGLFDGGTTAYRLCNGEGDRVPGLVLDRYGDAAVLRLDTEAWRPHLGALVEGLRVPLADRGVRALGLRLQGGAEGEKKLTPLFGELPERTTVLEHGMVMHVDLAFGQKTGAFLDQRENRARVRAMGGGRRRVLNLYSYAGGFSVAAALGGAEHVTSVDLAAAAHATAQRSFRDNGLAPSAHAFVTADVFTYLERLGKDGARFDLIISDPPSFAPSEKVRPRAERAYRRLHGAIAGLLAEGGRWCASSCSSHVPLEAFLATLDDASLGRSDLVVLDVFGQPADHPTLPTWPEGRYLKFVVLGT